MCRQVAACYSTVYVHCWVSSLLFALFALRSLFSCYKHCTTLHQLGRSGGRSTERTTYGAYVSHYLSSCGLYGIRACALAYAGYRRTDRCVCASESVLLSYFKDCPDRTDRLTDT